MRRNNQENIDPNKIYNFHKKGQYKKYNPRISTESQASQNNFVQCISGYIKSMVKNPTSIRKLPKSTSQPQTNYKTLSLSIEKQKQANKHLQKCVIEMQKVLWQRSENLQKIEQELKRKHKINKMNKTKKMISEESSIMRQSVEYSDQFNEEPRQRRKTQIPENLKNILVKTLAVKQPNRKKS